MPWRAGSEGPPAATASLLPSSPPESGIALCTFFTKGLCEKGDRNKERPFLHVKPAFKTQDCPWYDRGFCKHDLLCKYQHVCRTKCTNYLAGFCLEGPRCQFAQ
nr:putative cleavage and polyadenylation specificity factor subunit 4-like protein [Ovis aries]